MNSGLKAWYYTNFATKKGCQWWTKLYEQWKTIVSSLVNGFSVDGRSYSPAKERTGGGTLNESIDFLLMQMKKMHGRAAKAAIEVN